MKKAAAYPAMLYIGMALMACGEITQEIPGEPDISMMGKEENGKDNPLSGYSEKCGDIRTEPGTLSVVE